jgi:hypothetical protein
MNFGSVNYEGFILGKASGAGKMRSWFLRCMSLLLATKRELRPMSAFKG